MSPEPFVGEVRAATKIVATIGPASKDRVGELIDSGMSVARINFSHGDHDGHRRRVAAIRAAAEERGTAIGILADLQGPKLRLGRLPGGSRRLRKGDVQVLAPGGGEAREGEILLDFEGVRSALHEGDRVFLADGEVELRIESAGEEIRARVVRGGEIGDRKGVHLPDSDATFELPTEDDRRDLQLALQLGVDFLGVSYVSRAEEMERIRALAPGLALVAKIERRSAIENQRGILAAADGVMVARGDLGVELALEQLPLVQKSLIHQALRGGKFTIIATEMLESMVSHSRPTRAEVTDVANAVLDGTDAVMLSAETAVGAHPVEAVAAMSRIARAVEDSQRYQELPKVGFRDMEPTFSNATAMAACQAAEALGVRTIVCFTESGNTVRLISRYRPNSRIVALTPSERTLRSMTILSHVLPVLTDRRPSLEEMLHDAQVLLRERGLAMAGEEVIFVAGVPPGVTRSTNVMKLHRVGEPARLH